MGKRPRGQKAYCPLLLFKMLLMGQWHKLSDRELELYVWDGARHFCGLAIGEPVPDHSTISRFRARLVALGAWDGLLETVNDQLHARGMSVTVGAIVDASLTESPYSPKGGERGAVAEDRREAMRRAEDLRGEVVYHTTKQQTHPNADHDGRWLKKRNKMIYGYKKHLATDEAGMIPAVHTTPANAHDSKGLVPLIKKVRTQHHQEVLADKGYKSKANDEYLAACGSRSRIMHKGYRNRPINAVQSAENREVSRQVVDHEEPD